MEDEQLPVAARVEIGSQQPRRGGRERADLERFSNEQSPWP
jgi:hypothetical protein